MKSKRAAAPTNISAPLNPYPETDPATRYAWDVVNGRIVAGHLAIRACQRHLDDMEFGERRGLYWRPERASHALRFFPAVLRVTHGAKEGEPFNLPSYTAFVVGSLFGWVREDGRLRFREAWIEAGKGQIKALAIDTPIATPSGWTTMGELRAGDQVFDENGRPCNVICAHEVRTDGKCYAVRFDDGTEIVADSGHLWRTEARWSGSSGHGDAMRGVKLRDRGSWRKALRTTSEIASTITHSNGKYQSANHSIPLAGALDTAETALPIPPYTLGAWLGDGDSDSARITVSVDDWEIVDSIAADGVPVIEQKRHAPHIARVSLASDEGKWNRRNVARAVARYAIANEDFAIPELSAATGTDRSRASSFVRESGLFEMLSPRRGVGNGGGMVASRWRLIPNAKENVAALARDNFPVSVRLRQIGLLGNKHIPDIYKRSSRAQRLALLQGIMDTDGTIGVNGECAISSKWFRLAQDVHEIVVSLGIKSFFRSRRSRLNGRDIGPCHWVTFTAPSDMPVFRLKRKVERQAPRHSRRRLSGERRIVSCERVPTVPVRCITVDSSSQMFLAGRSLVPTHNSPLAAAIGLYTMAFRGIARSECYAIAKDRNQANVLFSDAVGMANAPIGDRDDGESLVSTGVLLPRGTGDMTWMLEHPASGSKFRALAGDEKVSGPRPSFVAADEIHEWRNDGPLKTWRSSGAKMPGDFLLWMSTNTPAADQIVGTEWSAKYQRILRREVDDDASFVFIARVDESDDPLNDESCWLKAMPCLDLTFPRENVRIEVNSSRHSVGTMLNTKRLYFGIPVGASEYWIDLDAWEAVQGRVDEAEMRGKPCWLGMDLSQKNDLTALGATWRDDDASGDEPKYYQTHRYWKPEEGLAQKAAEDNAPYVEWAAQGLLKTTPGKSIDYDFVAVEVQKFCAVHDVQAMAFDPAHIGEFRKACDRIGFETWIWEPDEPAGSGLKMIVHSQGKAGMHSKKALWMPRSLGQFEDLILTQQIVIDENPITKWCAGNAAVKPDEHGNRYFIKKNSRGRKDGMDAGAMSVGAAVFEPESAPQPMMFFLGSAA